MELNTLESATRYILEQAADELAGIETERDTIRNAMILHEKELNNYKKIYDVAKTRLPELLARLWLAKAAGDTKAAKLTQAEVDAAQKMIDRCLMMEQLAVDARLGLETLEKELEKRLRSTSQESPVAKRNNAQNVLAKIELYRQEGPRHAQSLAFLAAMLGLGFDARAAAKEAQEAQGTEVPEKKVPGNR